MNYSTMGAIGSGLVTAGAAAMYLGYAPAMLSNPVLLVVMAVAAVLTAALVFSSGGKGPEGKPGPKENEELNREAVDQKRSDALRA